MLGRKAPVKRRSQLKVRITERLHAILVVLLRIILAADTEVDTVKKCVLINPRLFSMFFNYSHLFLYEPVNIGAE